MKKLFKANPMAVVLIVVFLLLILVGVLTSKAAERRSLTGRRAASRVNISEPAGNFA